MPDQPHGHLGEDGWRESSRTPRRAPARRRAPRAPAALVEFALFDHLVCPDQHSRRNRQPEPLGRPYIDDQVKSYRLFHWQFARFSSSQNLVHEGRGPPSKLGTIRAIAHQATGLHKSRQAEDRREAMFRCNMRNLSLEHGS